MDECGGDEPILVVGHCSVGVAVSIALEYLLHCAGVIGKYGSVDLLGDDVLAGVSFQLGYHSQRDPVYYRAKEGVLPSAIAQLPIGEQGSLR